MNTDYTWQRSFGYWLIEVSMEDRVATLQIIFRQADAQVDELSGALQAQQAETVR